MGWLHKWECDDVSLEENVLRHLPPSSFTVDTTEEGGAVVCLLYRGKCVFEQIFQMLNDFNAQCGTVSKLVSSKNGAVVTTNGNAGEDEKRSDGHGGTHNGSLKDKATRMCERHSGKPTSSLVVAFKDIDTLVDHLNASEVNLKIIRMKLEEIAHLQAYSPASSGGNPNQEESVRDQRLKDEASSCHSYVLLRLLRYAEILQAEIYKRSCIVLPFKRYTEKVEHKIVTNISDEVDPNLTNQIVLELVPEAGATTCAECSLFYHDKSAYEILNEQAEILYAVDSEHPKCIPDTIYIRGRSCRAILFGIGFFLRNSIIGCEATYHRRRGFVHCCLEKGLTNFGKPKIKVRQHQVAFRPKTNSYDAFSIKQMIQEITDLALFGCNSIEIIPPGLDDAITSPHFGETTWLEMMSVVSDYCDQLDLHVSIWYPAFFSSYTMAGDENADTHLMNGMHAAEKHWDEVMNHLSRLDFLFIPGGDPGGHTPETILLTVAKAQSQYCTKSLSTKLASASRGGRIVRLETWVSTQFGLSKSIDVLPETANYEEHDASDIAEWVPKQREDDFFRILRENTDELLAHGIRGIVYGPWSCYSYTEFRDKVPIKFKLRNYPDICHTVGCQFPLQSWNLPLALSHGREPITVRPQFLWQMLTQGEAITDVLGCYSEGISDDVNKYVCLIAAWEGTDGRHNQKSREENTLQKLKNRASQQESSALGSGLEGCLDDNDTCSSPKSFGDLMSGEIKEPSDEESKAPQDLNQIINNTTSKIGAINQDFVPADTTTFLDLFMLRGVEDEPCSDKLESLVEGAISSYQILSGVNKFLFHGLLQYCKTMMLIWDPELAAQMVLILLDLERVSWVQRAGIHDTHMGIFRNLHNAFPIMDFLNRNPRILYKDNWRWNLIKLRIYYDEFVIRRLEETKMRTVIGGGMLRRDESTRSGATSGATTSSVPSISTTTSTQSPVKRGKMAAQIHMSFKEESFAFYDHVTPSYTNDPSFEQLTAEVNSLIHLLYSQIGYQTSVCLGAQHRQRGAFTDLYHFPINSYVKKKEEDSLIPAIRHAKGAAKESENATGKPIRAKAGQESVASPASSHSTAVSTHGTVVGHLNVGTMFGDFVLGVVNKCMPYSLDDEKASENDDEKAIEPITILKPSSEEELLKHESKHSFIPEFRLRPVLIAPPVNSSNYGTSSGTSSGGGGSVAGKTSLAGKLPKTKMRAISESKIAESENREQIQTLVRNTLVDQMYYSQVNESIASDHDQIAVYLIPTLPQNAQRWATLIWPTARMLYFLERLNHKKTTSNAKKQRYLVITYVGSEAIHLGGDWEELGREILATRCVARSSKSGKLLYVIHTYRPPIEETEAFEILFPETPEDEEGILIEFEVRDRTKISFVAIPNPVAEIAVVMK